MRYVVDASVALKWLVSESGTAESEELFHEDLLAPDWLTVECANALWRKHRQKLLSAETVKLLLVKLTQAPVLFVPSDGLVKAALELSLTLDHPVYDCIYLALALEEDAILVTADSRFQQAVAKHKSHRKHIQLLNMTASNEGR